MKTNRKLAACAVAWALLVLIGCKGNDLSTPKGAAKSFATAMENGDGEAAKRACTGGDLQIVDSMAKATGNIHKLREAAVSKFGEQGKSVAGAGAEQHTDWSKKVDDATVKEEGDTATLTPKEGGEPLKLKKVNGDWKVDVSAMTSGPMAGMGAAMFDSMGKAAAETTADINAGKYKTAEEARQAFGMKMMGGALGQLKMPDQPK